MVNPAGPYPFNATDHNTVNPLITGARPPEPPVGAWTGLPDYILAAGFRPLDPEVWLVVMTTARRMWFEAIGPLPVAEVPLAVCPSCGCLVPTTPALYARAEDEPARWRLDLVQHPSAGTPEAADCVGCEVETPTFGAHNLYPGGYRPLARPQVSESAVVMALARGFHRERVRLREIDAGRAVGRRTSAADAPLCVPLDVLDGEAMALRMVERVLDNDEAPGWFASEHLAPRLNPHGLTASEVAMYHIGQSAYLSAEVTRLRVPECGVHPHAIRRDRTPGDVFVTFDPVDVAAVLCRKRVHQLADAPRATARGGAVPLPAITTGAPAVAFTRTHYALHRGLREDSPPWLEKAIAEAERVSGKPYPRVGPVSLFVHPLVGELAALALWCVLRGDPGDGVAWGVVDYGVGGFHDTIAFTPAAREAFSGTLHLLLLCVVGGDALGVAMRRPRAVYAERIAKAWATVGLVPVPPLADNEAPTAGWCAEALWPLVEGWMVEDAGGTAKLPAMAISYEDT